ncbi:MAG: hypothetical protein HY289_15125 [Planctomycetes bacterium]|nr:hypothetical protein [Planctomycetota bacterium]
MGLLFCRFPERSQPLELAREFKQKMAPVVIDIDESDRFAASIGKIESALDAAGQKREEFQPLVSMKRNAAQNAPQYNFVLSLDQAPLMEGMITRHYLGLTWNDPLPPWVLTKVLSFAKAIPSAEVEVEDDAGNPIDVASLAQACA